MNNQPDYKKAFENAIVELCQSIGKDEVKGLDSILTQDKNHLEILSDIYITFPQFQKLFSTELNKI